MAINAKNVPLIKFFIEKGTTITDRFIELAKDLPEVVNLLKVTRKKQLADKIISLLSTPELLNTKRDEKTLLMEALKARVDQSHPELIDELISKSDVRITDGIGRTALLIAIENNLDETIISKLLKREKDLLHEPPTLDLEELKLPALERVLSEEDVITYADGVNSKDRSKRTALMIAIQNDIKGLVVFLLKNGADVDVIDSRRKSALFYAKDDPDITLMLKYAKEQPLFNVELKEKINMTETDWTWVNKLDDDGMTPLMKVALTFGHEEKDIEKLLKHADVDIQNVQGTTALIYAAETNNAELVSQLLDAGADVNKKDIFGFSAIDHAKNYPKIIDIFKKHQERQNKQHEIEEVKNLDKPEWKPSLPTEVKEKAPETTPLTPLIKHSFLASSASKEGKIPLQEEVKAGQNIIEIEALLQRLSSDMDSNQSSYRKFFDANTILEIRNFIKTYHTNLNENNLADFHSKTNSMLPKLVNTTSIYSLFLKMNYLSEPKLPSLRA
jgi:uncharacterized protein